MKNYVLRYGQMMFSLVILVLGLALGIAGGQAATSSVNEPTLFAPGIISTGDYECVPEVTPDGRTLDFVKSTPDMNF